MKNKILALFAFSVIAFAFLIAGVNAAVTMSQWDLTSNATATTSNSNLVASELTVGTSLTALVAGSFTANGVSTSTIATGTLGTTGWTNATSVDANGYYQVTLTPNTGVDFIISSLSFVHQSTDAMNFVVNWSKDSFTTSNTITSTAGASTTASATYSNTALEISVSAGETVTFRIYGYATAALADTFSVKTLNIQGEIVPLEAVDCVATGNNAGNLDVQVDDLSVEDGFGSDNEWFPLDTIKARIAVENNGNENIKSISLRWGLFNQDTQDWVMKEKEASFTLKDGDDKDVDLQFKLDKHVNDLTEGDYLFYAIATGKDASLDDVATCEMDSELVTIVSESNFVIIDDMQYSNEAQCLQEVSVTADIWNVGSGDEKDVYILVNNKDLGINNEKIEVGDVDSLDSASMSYTFIVPKGTVEKTYAVSFSVYNEDDDIFENDYDSDKSVFNAIVTGKGNCAVPGTASVSANLESTSVVAGEEITVTVTVKNTANKTSDFTVSADGYSAWASSAIVSNGTFSLNAGESKDVPVSLQIKEGVSGEQKFNINVLSAGAVVTTQPVAVTVQNGGFLNSLAGSSGSGNFLWIIGALNVLLVLAIIIIAVRFFSK